MDSKEGMTMTQPAFSKVARSNHDLPLKQSRARSRPPGPPVYHMPQIMFRLMRDILPFLMEMRGRYGDVVLISTVVGPFYSLTHPDGVRHILQENHLN